MKKNQNQKIGNLANINLDNLAKELENMNFKEKGEGREKGDLIYRYPESWGKREIGGIEGKGFRGRCRSQIKNFSNLIPLFAQKKRIQDLEDSLNEFYSFYAENYRIQDFSLNPFNILIKNDKDFGEKISIMMNIAKEFFEGNAEKERIESEEKKRIAKEKRDAKKKDAEKKKNAKGKEIKGNAGDEKENEGENKENA